MATKAELLARLQNSFLRKMLKPLPEAVEVTKEAYEALVAAQQHHAEGEAQQGEAASADGAPAGEAPLAIESAPLVDEDDKRFKQLLDSYNQRVNDIRRRKQKEEADNLAAKQAVMEELKASDAPVKRTSATPSTASRNYKRSGRVSDRAVAALPRPTARLQPFAG
ncbi:MAG: DUF349 domain-containing protein [Flavobacteriales bacterium]|nr:DUF349 domain-containing protein [Flavobacteriales bacterium]